jgi:hypothetical protein
MEKYQKGKVYAIICRKTGRRYVGSTCEPTLAKRLAKHNSDFNYWIKFGIKYKTSFDIIKDNDYYIVLLESYPCNSKDELRMCEQKHIDLYECVNNYKAFRSDEEKQQYYKQHRDEILERVKKYSEQNCDKILEYKKQYREENREKINVKQREKICCPNCQKKMSRGSLSRHKNICPQLKNEIETDVI